MDPFPPTPSTSGERLPPSAPLARQVSDVPAKIGYVLHLASLFTGGITSLVAAIVGYVYQGDAPPALATHYRMLIRTFWIGLLYGFVSGLLVLVVIGFAGFVFIAVWLIVRCVKGLRYLDRHEPYPDPATWLW
jgi:uncharacterized membrane protein